MNIWQKNKTENTLFNDIDIAPSGAVLFYFVDEEKGHKEVEYLEQNLI